MIFLRIKINEHDEMKRTKNTKSICIIPIHYKMFIQHFASYYI